MLNIPFTQNKAYLKWHKSISNRVFYREFFTSVDGFDFQIDISSDDPEKILIATGCFVVLKTRAGNVLYCPYGPTFITDPTKDEVEKIIFEIKKMAVENDCIFVRLENGVGLSENGKAIFAQNKNLFTPPKKSYSKEAIFQPRMEWWLELKKSEEEIVSTFSKNHRYSIRKSEKDGVEVLVVDKNLKDKFEDFYKIMQETASRDEFILQDKKYFESIFETIDNGEFGGYLLFSKIENQLNACALIIVNKGVANFVFGGSTNFKRESGATVRLQMESIIKAKSLGCEFYNFGGISEKGYGKDTLKPLTRYKKQFGGFSKYHGEFHDIPINKFKYYLYILRKMF